MHDAAAGVRAASGGPTPPNLLSSTYWTRMPRLSSPAQPRHRIPGPTIPILRPLYRKIVVSVPDGSDDQIGGFGMVHFDHPALRDQKATALVIYGIMAMRCLKEPDPGHPERPVTWVHAGFKSLNKPWPRFGSENTVNGALKELATAGAIVKHRGPDRLHGRETEYTLPLVGAQLLRSGLRDIGGTPDAHVRQTPDAHVSHRDLTADSEAELTAKSDASNPQISRLSQPRNPRTSKNPRDKNTQTKNTPAKNPRGARSDEHARRTPHRTAAYETLEAAQNEERLPNHGRGHTAGIANAIEYVHGDDIALIQRTIDDAIRNLDSLDSRSVDNAFADALGLDPNDYWTAVKYHRYAIEAGYGHHTTSETG